jgi:hypothetical protein
VGEVYVATLNDANATIQALFMRQYTEHIDSILYVPPIIQATNDGFGTEIVAAAARLVGSSTLSGPLDRGSRGIQIAEYLFLLPIHDVKMI